MTRYICVHGHFYQPPRENPWLEAIELQDSAYPYHDWNERVTAESYGPNASSRILDSRDRIVSIVNNYERISFNFGPTLLAWMQPNAPEVYRLVLEADVSSRERFSGHGNALAQCYNHMIMPLANSRDRRTQVAWGVEDFRHRFGRDPEGMWLPETAVDIDSLEALAEHGIRFTVLEPGQAARVREIGAEQWRDVSGGSIDPTRAYLQRLPSGREIALFFYDGPISRGVAFEGLLDNGIRYAERLVGAFDDRREWPQLINIATDGETYGHHHRHGEMAVAFALQHIERLQDVRLTNYGEYLERHPPTHEVQISEDTSWSCAHGVERWRSDCGCHTGGEPGWNQRWRGPLREALDGLRDAVAPLYEEGAAELLEDPWAARDAYIRVVLDRSPDSLDRYFAAHARRELGADDRVRALKLLEVQRHAMLMFTSCGWFFNELSGIETVQVIEYAGRVVQLAHELFGADVETPFLEALQRAESNLPEQGTGREIYESYVRPSIVDLPKVAAHYAVLSLFERHGERERVYCYYVDVADRQERSAGRSSIVVGRATITSAITREPIDVAFAAAHFGDHNVYGGVREFGDVDSYNALLSEASAAFQRADLPAIVRAIDRLFGGSTYSLSTLFRDEQRRILDRVLAAALQEAEQAFARVYGDNAILMRFIADLRMPQPKAFRITADFVLNNRLRELLEQDYVEMDAVREALGEARVADATLDAAGLGFALSGTLARLGAQLERDPQELSLLRKVRQLAGLTGELPFEVPLWELQNSFYRLRADVYREMQQRAESGDEEAAAWIADFRRLGERIHFAVA